MSDERIRALTASADGTAATIKGQATLLWQDVRAFLDGDPDLPDLAAVYAALSQLIDEARGLRDRVETRGVEAQRWSDEKIVALTGVGTFEIKADRSRKGFDRDACERAVVRLLADERMVDEGTGEIIDADPRYGAWILDRFRSVFRTEPRSKPLADLGLDIDEFHREVEHNGYKWRFDPIDRWAKAGTPYREESR